MASKIFVYKGARYLHVQFCIFYELYHPYRNHFYPKPRTLFFATLRVNSKIKSSLPWLLSLCPDRLPDVHEQRFVIRVANHV